MGGRRELTSRHSLLMTNVARRYYLQEQSKSEIAAVLGISRFRVARLLDDARDVGIVRIDVGWPGSNDMALSAELKETFDLEHAVVVDAEPESQSSLFRSLGHATTELLCEIVRKGDVLGLASARALHGIGDDVTAFPRCTIVQLTGAISRPDAVDVIQGIRGLTEAGGGSARVFYAPMVSVKGAPSLRDHPDVARAFDMVSSITIAAVGVGAWAPQLSLIHESVSDAERREAHDAGVRFEVAGILLDAVGQPVNTPIADRVLGPTFQELMTIPLRIGVAYGTGKGPAVCAAISSGAINGLITHRELAVEALNSWEPRAGGGLFDNSAKG